MKRKTVMLIPQLILPIPAVKGGAIETLITNWIDVNEEQKKLHFVVISQYDEEATQKIYDHTEILYFKDGRYVGKAEKAIHILYELYRVFYKIFQNHISRKVIGAIAARMDYQTFQYYFLCKRYHADFVSLEAEEKEAALSNLNRVVGREHIYNHIHYTRKENIKSREYICNSISISEYVRSQWVKNDSVPGIHKVLYNAVDISKFQKEHSREEKRLLRQKLGLSENDLVVVFCGRLMQEKGITELLDAFEQISDPHIKLLLIGSAALNNQASAEYARMITERAAMMPNVLPLGYIPNNVLPDYYAMSDLQVIPSIWEEGAGLVAIEGMAAGLPQIITESGGMVEYSTPECSVHLPIDEDLAQNLAREILRLSADAAAREQMGKNGKLKAAQFTKEKYYEDFVHIVNESFEED